MEDLLAWLRATIQGDLTQAKAAEEAAPGPWVNTGQDGQGSDTDAWQIHGAPTGDTTWKYDRETEQEAEVPVLRPVATTEYDDGGGVWEKAAADHMVLQQPRDTIARCEAELALLDKIPPVLETLGWIAYSEGQGAAHPDKPGEYLAEDEPAEYFVKLLAVGYRHRSGFKPSWLEPTPVKLPFDWARTEAEIAGGRIADPVWLDVSKASAEVRRTLGLDASMAEARDIPHPFVKAEGDPYGQVEDVNLSQFCAACGAISPLMAHKESWPSRR